MNKKKDYLLLGLLVLAVIVLIWAIIPSGYLFGSHTDWLSQHITIADNIRQLFYQTHDLFPDYIAQLGAGQNIYQLSYYGLFRPDVLISLFLPFVAMKDIMITSMILCIILSACFCYIWLRGRQIRVWIAFSASLLLICSGPLIFHAHRQIMFVNYMPWLFTSLIAVDRIHRCGKGKNLLIISIILMILNSYFYSVSGILILLIYDGCLRYQKQQWELKHWLNIILPMIISVAICGILLFPTLSVMLESKRGGGDVVDVLSLLIPNLTLDSLFYKAYSAGVTAALWIMLVVGWMHENRLMRILSRIITVAFLFPLVPFLMNGMLYARAKILIVFLPFIVLYVALYVTHVKEKQWKLWHIPCFFIPLFGYWITKQAVPNLLIIDLVISFMALGIMELCRKQQGIIVINMIAIIACLEVNKTDSYVSEKQYANLYQETKAELLDHYLTKQSRFEDFTNNLNTSNLLQTKGMKKPSYYTSLNNQAYNQFFYDIVRNPISIRNRTAQVSSNNVFFQGMMGSRFVYTNGVLPAGYEALAKLKNGTLGENHDVMPLAYATSDLMSEQQFQKFSYPYTLDTIYNQAIVSKSVKDHSYQSKIQKINQPFELVSGKHVNIIKNDDGYIINAARNTKVSIPVVAQSNQQVLLISFDVLPLKVADSMNISISINGIKNTLSASNAAYPNENHRFHYTLSSNQDYDKLRMHFSKGSYRISNIKCFTMDLQAIEQRRYQVDEMTLDATQGKEVMKGNLEVSKDGYFITSLPYQKGYHVTVDGKTMKPEKVNTAFLGFPMKSGSHEVTIEFHAPMKQLGVIVSIIGIGSWILINVVRRKTHA